MMRQDAGALYCGTYGKRFAEATAIFGLRLPGCYRANYPPFNRREALLVGYRHRFRDEFFRYPKSCGIDERDHTVEKR